MKINNERVRIIEYINKNIIDVKGNISSSLLGSNKFKNSDIRVHILEHTKFLSEDAKFGERIFCIRNNINEIMKCICGRNLKFISNVDGYLKSCNRCFRSVYTNWGGCSDTKKNNIHNEYLDLINYINDPSSIESSEEDVINFIEIKLSSKTNKSTNKLNYNKWVIRSDIRDNKNILKR